jgi:PAS domain S-box-containing protein
MYSLQRRYLTAEAGNQQLLDNINAQNSDMKKQQAELEKTLAEVRKAREEDERRSWIANGITECGNILRGDLDYKMYQRLITKIVQYMGVVQGGIYTVEEDDHRHETHLQLQACYAFDRIKFLTQRIDVGKGLVGQCYLEQEPIYITKVPENYINITSGLGGASPNVLLIVPLIEEGKVEGVIELASLKELEPHQREFIERFGETLAAFIGSYRVNQKTRILLEQSQQQTEEMRAQEEEMRQNMEELQATQEEMARKEREMKQRYDEIEKLSKDLEMEHAMFTGLMDLLADRITIKDKDGRYLRVNKTKADSFATQGILDIAGKSDADLYSKEHFERSIAEERRIMQTGKPVLNKEDKIVMPDGRVVWGATSRAPFKNENGEMLGTLVVTRDITAEKAAKEALDEAEKELEALKAQDE